MRDILFQAHEKKQEQVFRVRLCWNVFFHRHKASRRYSMPARSKTAMTSETRD